MEFTRFLGFKIMSKIHSANSIDSYNILFCTYKLRNKMTVNAYTYSTLLEITHRKSELERGPSVYLTFFVRYCNRWFTVVC